MPWGDRVAFAGSLNETSNGYSCNVEQFDVFKSWVAGEKEYEEHYFNEFESYWSGKSHGGTIIVDMPPGVLNTVSMAYNGYIGMKTKPMHQPIELWEHQKSALSKWEENGMCGIVEMATGTGKTIMALNAALMAGKISGPLLVVIAVPTDSLRSQWQHEAILNVSKRPLIINNSQSIIALENEVKSMGRHSMAIAIGTYSILSNEKFLDFISGKINCNCMLIADEVHGAGSPKNSSVLNPKFKFRLGISATPIRYMDEEGTNLIMDYFNGIVFSYSTKEAIADGRIVPYGYFPIFSRLSLAEMDEYVALTKKYAKIAAGNKDNGTQTKNLKNILIARAKILKKASGKILEFKEIARKLSNSSEDFHAIVFYEDKDQMKSGNEVLDSLLLKYYTFDSRNNTNEREGALKMFKANNQSFLCTIRAADEGINIPEANVAIIFSETGNPRQGWQRLGRVLRKTPGKKVSSVYEISAMPEKNITSHAFELEHSIATKEIKRMCILCSSAENMYESAKSLALYGNEFDINVWKYLNEIMHL